MLIFHHFLLSVRVSGKHMVVVVVVVMVVCYAGACVRLFVLLPAV